MIKNANIFKNKKIRADKKQFLAICLRRGSKSRKEKCRNSAASL